MSVYQPSQDDACELLNEMTESMASTRKAIQSLRSKPSESLDTKDGVSLLSLKHHVLLSYLHSLVLLNSRRVLGDENTLKGRSPPSRPFSDPEREQRGSGLGDLVDQMIEGRLVLEKIKALEGRMKYQIEKLIRIAQEGENRPGEKDAVNDPLAFRPNPQNLAANDDDEEGEDKNEDKDAPSNESDNDATPSDGIYRPPKIAPTPYLPQSMTTKKDKRDRNRTGPIPTSLSTLIHTAETIPHTESSSGLGGSNPSFTMLSSRARYLKDLTEFEESQFGRVMMSKKESKRRARDERDLALGGGLVGVGEDGRGATSSRRRGTAGGFEDEFGDVLRDIGRSSRPGSGPGDAYEELRRKGKKAGVLERSRDVHKKRKAVEFEDGGREEGKRKRSRFESERKNVKQKRKSV